MKALAFPMDSLQIEKLEALSREESIIQNYALAARALRGDTVYHLHPAIDDGISARIAGNQQQTILAEKSDEEIKIYPNPSHDQFLIDFNDNVVNGVTIISIEGKVVDRFTLSKHTKQLSVNSSYWALSFIHKSNLITNRLSINWSRRACLIAKWKQASLSLLEPLRILD